MNKSAVPYEYYSIVLHRAVLLKTIARQNSRNFSRNVSRETFIVFLDSLSKNVICAGILKDSDDRWTDDEPALYLHNFVSEVGKTGVGAIFLQSATDLALERGKKYLRLDSSVDNDKLAKYYEKQLFFQLEAALTVNIKVFRNHFTIKKDLYLS